MPALLGRVAASLDQARRANVGLVLLVLLPVPPLLIGHQLHFWDLAGFDSSRWNVDLDRSYIEILGYAYVAAAVALLVLAWRRERERVYAGWALVLTVIVIDDSFRLHETGGTWLAGRTAVPTVLGLREKDIGQLVTWALIGAVVLLALWLTHRPRSLAARDDSFCLLAMLGLLVVVAVGVDMLSVAVAAVTDSTEVKLLLLWIESGGEIGVMAGLVVYAWHVVRRPGRDQRLWPYAADAARRAPAAS